MQRDDRSERNPIGSPLPGPRSAGEAAPGDEGIHSLTPREREVLGLMARGMNNREIASTLFISMHTVKNHISSIYRKMGSGDRTRVVLTAIRKGVVPFE